MYKNPILKGKYKLKNLKETFTIGEKYKYKALCEAFDLKPSTGNTKIKHFKEFEQHLKLEKEGTWFKLIEIYDTPKEKEDGRRMNTFTVRHEQESIFKPDELQLGILWLLGIKAYENKARMNQRKIAFFPTNELYVAVGLCNEYFNMLSRQRHYYCKMSKDDTRETVYDLWQVNLAFNGVYDKMKRYTTTAFNQLQRKKAVEYSYWKTWNNGKTDNLFTDEHMYIFVEKRQDAFEWWNETHPNRSCDGIGDIYNKLNAKEIKEFEDYLVSILGQEKEFKGIKYYNSCFKVFYSLRTIRKELINRGFEIGETREDFEQAFEINMKDVIERVNTKFIDLNLQRIEGKREEHFQKFNEYEEQMGKFSNTADGHRGFGRRVIKEPKRPYYDLIHDEKYEETKEVFYLGVDVKPNENQGLMILTIEHCVETNKNN
uniref:Uncharacterized protein n=1 Tax=Siphoviridae sp. ctqSm5 TaxID=2827949 RepID=A0A8S5SNX2_9CAUD|nr:MAG TPA: hypothetical protein [Siphoviridae sp. ctqSm5]